MSEAPAPAATGRPMRYPYTLTAKLAQFPFKYHYNNVWLFKYWLFGIAVSLPLFVKIGRASFAPANVKTWEEIRRRDFSGHH
ncbi:Hypothetical protein NTJ_14557 [Nesidiocoris tenuis]|uniref:Uncharacterized protein n=1 Tax=Nesidiocoris tenuis TaxID=355587 RepID=A0ABN7BBI1_9HEMI|nr:Hypothetical protein NTJ_14557 [Nesidiocoris tenuis]